MNTNEQQRPSMTDAEKIAAWDRVASEWATYCHDGAGAFDWDYDSRDTMCDLTNHWPFGMCPAPCDGKGSQQALDNLFLAAALEDEKGDYEVDESHD